jgi:NAD(P)-dependent dehydrogenase (short-subunit alcohol dehydrogenase family)
MKTAIVTGASGNLGQAVIKKFLAKGYHVTGTLIPGDPFKPDFDSQNFEAAIVDLADEKEAAKLVTDQVEKHKQVEAAVLTVGGFAMGNMADTSTVDILKQYRLNFETAYNMARPLFNQMKKKGSGRIFMIGSRPGADMRQSKGMVAYGLSKSLIFRLAELMNEEAKGTDVVASVVIPSTIDTPQNRKSMPDADFSTWVSAEAIANIIYFYCTPEGAVIREPLIKVYNNA